MKLDLERVQKNVRKASTEDLLDRATVYRSEMEPEALAIIDAELGARGVSLDKVAEHLEKRRETLTRHDGTVIKCSCCWKPAVVQEWSWHRIFGRIPVFPRRFRWCEDHRPRRRESA